MRSHESSSLLRRVAGTCADGGLQQPLTPSGACVLHRCGPFDVALSMLAMHEPLRAIVNAMTTHVFNIREGEQAITAARTKGTLKVQLEFS